MLPSQRARNNDRRRGAPARRVTIWRCVACLQTYDWLPYFRFENGLSTVGCTKCGAGESFLKRSRVKD